MGMGQVMSGLAGSPEQDSKGQDRVCDGMAGYTSAEKEGRYRSEKSSKARGRKYRDWWNGTGQFPTTQGTRSGRAGQARSQQEGGQQGHVVISDHEIGHLTFTLSPTQESAFWSGYRRPTRPTSVPQWNHQ